MQRVLIINARCGTRLFYKTQLKLSISKSITTSVASEWHPFYFVNYAYLCKWKKNSLEYYCIAYIKKTEESNWKVYRLQWCSFGHFVLVVKFVSLRSSRFGRFGGFACFVLAVSVVSFCCSGFSACCDRSYMSNTLKPLQFVYGRWRIDTLLTYRKWRVVSNVWKWVAWYNKRRIVR